MKSAIRTNKDYKRVHLSIQCLVIDILKEKPKIWALQYHQNMLHACSS